MDVATEDESAGASTAFVAATVVVDLVIGIVVSAVVAASYIPQHVQCLKLRSAEGLSLWTILISTISGVALTLANLLGDGYKVDDALFPHYQNPNPETVVTRVFYAVTIGMPMLQSLLMVCVGTPSYIVHYFRFAASHHPTQSQNQTTDTGAGTSFYHTISHDDTSNSNNNTTTNNNITTAIHASHEPPGQRRSHSSLTPQSVAALALEQEHSPVDGHGNGSSQHRFEVMATAITWLLVAVSVAVSVWALVVLDDDDSNNDNNSSNNNNNYHYSSSSSMFRLSLVEFWGTTATVTNAVQWIPQIDTTWMVQHEGVLSVASLIFSIVGDGILALYWIRGVRNSNSSSNEGGGGVSVWVYMTLAADAFMQLILVGMILYFRAKRRWAIHNNNAVNSNSNSNAAAIGTVVLSERQESLQSTPLLSALSSSANARFSIEPVPPEDDGENDAPSPPPTEALPVSYT